MEDHRDRAVAALEDVAARIAGDARREPAAIEEEDRLVPLGERLRDGRVQPWRERSAHAHVGELHALDGWQRARADAIGKQQPLVSADLRVVPGLERRRRAAEHDDGARALRAHHRDVARVIPQPLLLLVAPVVLLVDDENPEVPERREDGAACADRDPRLATAKPPPLVVALPVGQSRMQHGNAIPEARAKASGELRRERDLRHQNQRGAPLFERGPDRAQIDLGLAAAGHALQQEGREGLRGERFLERRERGALRGRERRRRRRLVRDERRAGGVRRAQQLVLSNDEEILLHELRRGRRAARAEALADLRCGQLALDANRLEELLLRGRALPRHLHPAEFQRLRDDEHALRLRVHAIAVEARGERRAQHQPERIAVVLGDPARERELVRGDDRSVVERLENVLRLAVERLRVLGLDDDPGGLPPAERHAHPPSDDDLRREPFGHAVGERRVDGDAERDFGKGRHRRAF